MLTGEYTVGSAKMEKPPPKNPRINNAILYDSLVDDERNPSIFVAVKDSQAYPQYLVVCKARSSNWVYNYALFLYVTGNYIYFYHYKIIPSYVVNSYSNTWYILYAYECFTCTLGYKRGLIATCGGPWWV